MQQNEIMKLAGEILSRFGESPHQVSYLAKGATCTVWLVRTADRQSLALRIIDDEDRVIDGATDMAIRQAVRACGGHVAAAVSSSESLTTVQCPRRWVLDAFVAGTHPERGALSDAVCRQLGETVALLHQLPVRNFGRLMGVEQGVVIGETTLPMAGVKQRFENPLPETWEPGYTHPVLDAVPEIANAIAARLARVSQIVQEPQGVLCHTDLHEGQMLCGGDNLSALIDFGGAAILSRYWDLGSVYYFHGKQNFAKFHDAYCAVSGVGETDAETVRSCSVALAMHHASRARLPGKHHRFQRAVEHIRGIISD